MLTEVNPLSPLDNRIGVFLLLPVVMGGVAGELEPFDAETGERQLAFAACRDGSRFPLLECFVPWGHVRHGMRRWSRMVNAQLAPPEQRTGLT